VQTKEIDMHHFDIHEHMNVVGSNGKQIGTVDHMEGDFLIQLSKKGPSAGGKAHIIPLEWVDHVDEKVVHLDRCAIEAVAQWLPAH
jgi:hypothetical protein